MCATGSAPFCVSRTDDTGVAVDLIEGGVVNGVRRQHNRTKTADTSMPGTAADDVVTTPKHTE